MQMVNIRDNEVVGRTGGDMSHEESRLLLRKVTLRLIPFLFLLYIVAYLDRTNVSFVALQMKQTLHFSDQVYGFGAGIFFIGYFLFEVPSNLILERVGARFWIARIMVTWGIVAIAMATTRTPAMFYTFRFLLGLAEAGFFPGVIFYLTIWYTPAERAKIVGLFMTATTLSGVIGGPVSGYLLNIHKFALEGWQWLFILEGIPAILLAGVVIAYLPNGPGDARWLTENEKTWLLHRHTHTGSHHFSLREAFTNPVLWRFCIIYFGITTSAYAVTMWMPIIIKEFGGLSTVQVGFLSALPPLGATIAMVGVGAHSDYKHERRIHLSVSLLFGALGFMLITLVHSPWAVIMFLTLAVSGMVAGLGPFWAQPTAALRGAAAAGGIAFINSVGNLGGFVGPYVMGVLKQRTHSNSSSMWLLAILALIASAAAATAKKQH